MHSPSNVYSLNKRLFILLLIFSASSIFAFVLPSILSSEENKIALFDDNSFAGDHPLDGISDNMVICPNDGSQLHEIYLCGANAERLIATNIPDMSQITWSKLQEGSCGAAVNNCPNTLAACTWNQISTNTQYTITEGGEYRVLVRYNNGTSEYFYFNVFANGLNPNAVVTNIDCGTPGSITINNVPSAYEFSINSGASWQDSNLFSINSVSSYDIQIRRKDDTEGCVFNLDNVAVDNNSIDATTTILPITCNTAKGGIQVDISNASTTYIFKISQGGILINSSGPINTGTYVFANLDAGTYDIQVNLASISNCTYNATETLQVFTNIQPNVVVTKNIDCTDGILTSTPTGGTAPYEYSLDNGVTYASFTSLTQAIIPVTTTDSYTLKVKDANGCEVIANTVSVVTEPEIIYNVTSKNISCNSTDNGSVTIAVTNSQGYSISYSLDNGVNFQSSNVFSNLSADTYTVIIRKEKAGGFCDITAAAVTVEISPDFTASASVTQQIDCANGSATISVTVLAGGTAPFEYSLNGIDFQASSNLTGLGAGEYTITIKDDGGCTTTVDQSVSSGANPSELTFLTSDIDCSTGETDVQITVQNGTAPFTYKITAPSVILAPGDTFVSLAPNTYTFEVTAANGCKIVRTYTVPNPINFTANALVKNDVSCATTGTSDGTIELSVANFNTSFSVLIEDSASNDTGLGVTSATTSPVTITGFEAGTYTLKITDESGPCEKIETITIAAPTSALTIDSFAVTNINCGTPGSVTVEASGGWGNYSYAIKQPDNTITPVQSNKTITSLLQAGLHTILVTDINGCLLDTETFDLIDQGGPTSIVDIANSSYCYSTATKGELKIDVSGGESPYFYTVNNGTPLPITSGTFTLSNLTPDDYLIKVIGGNGCETIVEDTKIAGQLFATAQITKPLGCGTTPDAVISVTAEEGYPNPLYNYEVSKDGSAFTSATMPFSASNAGNYSFRIFDSKGCETFTDPVEVIQSPALTTSHDVSNTACGKAGTGSVQLIANGGTPPFLYSFDGSAFTTKTLYTGLDATSYTYSIKDALGCELTDIQAIVGAEAAITADITKSDISCDPLNGGTQWGNTNINNIQNATGLVTIRLIRVSSPAAHAAGTARYWTYREYQNIDMSTRPSGYNIRMYWPHHFYVEIEDEKGCVFESDLFEITQPALPWIQRPANDLDQSCANGATFQVEVGNPTELIGPFKYRIWPYDETNPPSWRSFEEPTENEAFGEDTDVNGIERDFRVSGLLFGVSYAIVLYDENTGCQRWRYLGNIGAPQAPDNAIDVISTPQSLSCYSGMDGKVKFTVKGADDFNGDGIRNVSWSIRHTSDYGQGGWTTSYQQSGTANDGGTGGDVEIDVTNLRVAWYVVEVTTESGCKSGNRFLIYRPKTSLKLELDQYVPATCNIGAQISVIAKGGWNQQRYFNIRNKLDQSSWHEFEYAYVVSGTDPVTLPASEWSAVTNKIITPTAYDGTNNIYQVYVRDGGGCIKGLGSPITITKDAVPLIDTIDVTNRCTSINEIYDVVATFSSQGTNPVNGTPKYIWDGEVTSTPNKQLGPGNHTLVVRDENGCTDTQNIFIYPQLVAKSEITKTVNCDSGNSDNGEMLASAYGGSGDFEFTINPIPATYSPGEETNTTGVFDRLAAGVNYTYTVTDTDPQILPSERCPSQDAPPLQLITPVDPEFIVATNQSISCNGANDGKIIIQQKPATDNLDVTYEYQIDGNSYQASNIFDALSPGLHNVSIRSAKNCIQTISNINISEPTALVLDTPTVSGFTCTTSNNLGMATIDVTTNGTGTAPYLYSFNGSSFTSDIIYNIPFLTTSRTISVAVIDANNCTDQISVVIPAATKVTATITRVSVLAMNCVDNEIIEIIGANGSGSSNYEVRELPSGNLINGTGQGQIDLGSGNPGTYVYQLTDTVTGCTVQVSHTIASFDTIETVATKLNDIYCFGGSDGGIQFTVSGYTGAFNYNIFNANAPTVSVVSGSDHTSTGGSQNNTLVAGTYFIEIVATDAPKCTVESNRVTIQSPVKVMDFSFAQTQYLTCLPGSDAQITATPEGGWGGYEFQLIDTANPSVPIQAYNANNIFSGLSSGINYELTLRDVKGCSNVTHPITINPIDLIAVSETHTEPNCPGADDASITINATRTNGPASYQYILNNIITGISSVSQSSNIFNGLVQGQYSVTVTDSFNCDATTTTISIVDPAAVEIDGAITQEPTCTPSSGEITVSAIGGTGGFEFRIISPAIAATAWSSQQVYSSLAPGTYEFLARDAHPARLCESLISVIRTINVVDPFEVTVNDDNTIINCNGDADAVLVAEATGGLGGYQYQLEVNGSLQGVPQDSGIFEHLGQGSYRIRAISGIDCEDYNDTPIIISEPPVLSGAVTNITHILCYGEENANISINAIGGVAPYQYIISSQPQKAVQTNVFENLKAGTYSVIIQDTNGCEVVVDNITINTPSAPLSATVIQVDDEECSRDDNGLIELLIEGGTAPYTYSLTGVNDNTSSISGSNLVLDNLDGGFYTIYLTDDNGCTEIIVQEIKVGVDLTASHETIYECIDGQPVSTTTITLVQVELTNDVLYALDSENPADGQELPVFENISAGNHYLSIIHEGGCIERLDDVIIKAVAPLTLTLHEGTINEILVEANGGDGSYTYYFEDNPSSEGSFFINHDDTYTIRVIDGKGCETTLDVPMEFIDIEIPNFFTPDGDGYKDTWVIGNSEGFPDMYIKIYDRYGRTIKEFIGKTEWDGSYKKTDLPTGDYWYILKLNGQNDTREFVGHVTVYR